MLVFAAPKSRQTCGFTLTEIAIVLGLIGLVLGAIWLAASKVYQNNRVQLAVKETAIILQGFRGLYTAHPVDSGGNFVDITCTGVNSGFFPNDMLVPAACVTNNSTTYPRHPWDDYMQIWAHDGWQGVVIGFTNLPQSACVQLTRQIGNAPDIIFENVNGTSVTLPPFGVQTLLTTAQIATACLAGNVNFLQLGFKAR